MIYKIAEIIAVLFDAVLMLWYVPGFLNTSFFKKENKTALIILALHIQILICSFLAGYEAIALIISLILVVLYAFLICEKKWLRAALSSGSFILVMVLTSVLLYPLIKLIFGDGVKVAERAETPERILYLVICLMIRYAIFRLLLLLFRSDDNKNAKTGVFSMCHTAVIVFGLFMLMYFAVNDTERRFTVPIMAVTAILIFSNYDVFFLIKELIKMQRREYEFKMIELKMKAEKARAEDADAIWENIKRFRHDMKNHFTVLKAKLREGDKEACEQYIDEISPTVESAGNLVHTGNAVIDYMINTKFSPDKGIKMIVSGYAGMFSDVDDADLVSLLGNILDNAFEAVNKIPDQSNRLIELHFLKKNQNRIIVCKNTVSGPVLDKNGELKKTSKEGEHGYGHKIIASVSEKYYGFCEYLEQDGMLCLQVVLPEKE